MATTTSVRFDFHWESFDDYTTKPFLVAHYPLPSDLIGKDAHEIIFSDPKAKDLLSDLVHRHIDQLWFLAHSQKQNCTVCGVLPTRVAPHATTLLHEVEDPSVYIHAIPLCDKDECVKVHQQRLAAEDEGVEARPEVQASTASSPGMQDSKNVPTCNICHKSEGAKLCDKCKTIAYCSKEHQEEDRKRHEKICGWLAKTETAKITMR